MANQRRVGRPRKFKPADVPLSHDEATLAEMTVTRAQRDAVSFERAFAKTINTDAGRPLYQQIKEGLT